MNTPSRTRKWNIITVFVLVALSVSFVFARDTVKGIQNDNPATTNSCIPETYASLICNPDSIQWVIIDPWTPSDSALVYLGNEPIGEILNSEISSNSRLNELTEEILLSPTSFQNDSIVKESVFMPDYGILYMADSDSLLVSYSLYCDLCRFQNKDGYIDYNGENVRDELLIILRELFPKDKFVRNVTRSL